MKTRAGLPGMTGIERTAKLSSDGGKPEQPAMAVRVRRPRAEVSSGVYGLKFRGPNIVSLQFLTQAQDGNTRSAQCANTPELPDVELVDCEKPCAR